MHGATTKNLFYVYKCFLKGKIVFKFCNNYSIYKKKQQLF